MLRPNQAGETVKALAGNGQRKAPMPPGNFLLGHVRHMLRGRPIPLGGPPDLRRRRPTAFGTADRVRVLPVRITSTTCSSNAARISPSSRAAIRNSDESSEMGCSPAKAISGSGKGDWRSRPCAAALGRFCGRHGRRHRRHLPRMERAAILGQPVDMAAEMMRLTLRIVGETLLGTDVTGEANDVGAG